MITDRLIERIIELQNPTCVGLDTSFDYLPDDMRAPLRNRFRPFSYRRI